ncbi:MAG: hypothetical protein K940chlam7_01835 [Chlamydiae bacterium]|nr:hypothetical protein [Chlamydiota bacterium]
MLRFGAYLSMTFGAIGFFLFRMVDFSLPNELVTIILSLVGYILGQRVKMQIKLPETTEEVKV